jgi:hypothetical protein
LVASAASDELPEDVVKLLGYVASTANSCGNRIQSAEADKLKADMMRLPHRWAIPRVAVNAVRTTCDELGMTPDDI